MAAINAEEASSSYPSNKKAKWGYDVFLSFRGEDTRTNFTDHLFTALNERSIMVFRDDLDLDRGKAIALELLKAIEEARISVIIFSKDYASSTWCLDEVVKIVQCMNSLGQIVLPVFYDVNPSEVRKQTGKYQEAFDKHEVAFKHDVGRLHKWRAALKEVANLSGWDRKNQHESKFIQEIAEAISNKLFSMSSPAIEGLVGMDSRLAELSSYVDIGSDDVRIVGICGLGGIGKTTIARAYYNQMSQQFEGSTFLANVREVSSKWGVLPLQEQILCEILKGKNSKVWNVYEGIEMIRARLRFKRVLIVIDDVDQLNQLKELAGKSDWFGSGSRIIITTRDENLLVRHGVDIVYKVKRLDILEAIQLFSFKAFKDDLPPQDYWELSAEVVRCTNGLPLALEVMGSFLFGRTIKEWNSAIDRMREDPRKEILDTLKISFDELEETEQKVFLDIACFFKGVDKDRVTEILDSCGFYPDIGIKVLIDKSLITILKNNKLWMHDMLQELGWKVVRQESPSEPGKRSRLWLYQDIFNVLTRNTGSEDVEGMILELPKQREEKLNAKALSKMTKLRLLVFHNVRFSDNLEYLSNELRFLQWHEYPMRSLPPSFNAEELIELDMRYSQALERLWGGIKNFKKLKIINLSHSQNLVKTPDFRGVPNLEELILEGCTNLKEIDQSIAVLEGLVLLNLQNCKKLATLPNSIQALKALKTVSIAGCSKLDYTLELFGCAEYLEELDVSGTAVKPSSFTCFKNLRRLSLHGCKEQPNRSLFSMFNFFAGKSCLPSMSLHSFSGLSSLVSLDLSYCNLLGGSIPSDLSCLSSLTALHLSGNNFVRLPASINGLSKLECLYMDDCKNLQSLQDLPLNLKFISAQACISLEKLPEKLELSRSQSPPSPEFDFSELYDIIKFRLSEGNLNDEDLLCILAVFIMKTLMNLDELQTSGPKCDLVFQYGEIPEWFTHRSLENSVSIHLFSPNFEFMGFALSAIFTNHDQPVCHFSNVALLCATVIKREQRFEGFWSHSLVLKNCHFPKQEDNIWLFYLPSLAFSNKAKISSVRITDLSGHLAIKKCGARLVYEQDFKDFGQQFSIPPISGRLSVDQVVNMVYEIEEKLEFPLISFCS